MSTRRGPRRVKVTWDQNELGRWQARLNITGAAAARALGMDYQAYIDHMPGGRLKRLRPTVVLLCRYIERYGINLP
jgi:hypothetical protein